MKLRLASDLIVPVDAVTETFGIVGIRGSGKSTTAKVLVEELTKAGQQSVVIDPLGSWWGLKAAADGKRAGLPFTILGGTRADVPITLDAGAVIADLVVDSDAPLILDLSLMRKGEQRRFMLAFVEQLFHRADGTKAVHVVVDECDLYCPQRPLKGEERLLGAMEDLVRRGRFKGLGVSLISQRPATIHKDVLSQVSVLVAHRLIGPQDRNALDAWVQAHGTPERRATMMGSLASQQAGQAWFWSPAWLDIFRQVQVRAPETFDSSATPKAGEKRIEPKVLAPVDLEQLRDRMATVVARAEENDPKALKRRIVELERELAKRPTEERVVEVEKVVEVEVRTIPTDLVSAMEMLAGHGSTLLGNAQRLVKAAEDCASLARSYGERRPTARQTARPPVHEQPATRGVTKAPARQTARPDTGDVTIGGTERKVLSTLIRHGALTNDQIALLAGYSAKASTVGVALGKLRRAGLVTDGQPARATPAGTDYLGDDVEQLPEGRELLDYWRNYFGLTERKVLDALVAAWPHDTSLGEVAAATGYSPSASTIGVALGKLRKVGVVDRWRLSDDFARAIGETR